MKKILFVSLAVSLFFCVVVVGTVLAQDTNSVELQNTGEFVSETYFMEDEDGEEIQITKEEFDALIADETEEVEITEYTREAPTVEDIALEDTAEPGDASACFELYPFGQLDITADLDKSSYTPGDTANLNLSVTNNNSNTSIENGEIIFQIRKVLEETNTTILLHEEVLSSNLKYPRKDTVENSLSFTVPDSLPNGIYQGYISITDNGYPISGLSFTQDVAGRVVALRVADSKDEFDIPYVQEEKAMLIPNVPSEPNRKEISINPFQIIQTIAPFEAPATITVPIYNPSDTSKRVNIKADLHFWDELDELISSANEEVLLDPNSSETLSLEVPKDLGAGTYMLRVVLDSDVGKVISKIRFSVAGSAPRIYYSGITEKSEMFVCIGNTTVIPAAFNEDGTEFLEEQPFSKQGKTVLILTNTDTGEEIDRFEYEGDLFEPWAPKIYKSQIEGNLPENISLSTMVYGEDGNLLETREVSYEDLNDSSQYLIYILIALALVIAFVFIKNCKEDTTSNIMPILIVALIVTASFSYFGDSDVVSVKKVEAQSTTNDNHFLSTHYSDNTYGAGVNLYTNQSIDFLPDSGEINPGSSFNLAKTNYGSWYSVTNGFRTPLFSFSDTSMSSSGTAPMSIMWGAVWTSRHPAVTLNFPYTDTWTTSDPEVTCSNTDVDTAGCDVSASFSGSVDITQTRQITIGGLGITDIPGSIMGRDWLRAKVVPEMQTKSVPYYALVKPRCQGRGCWNRPGIPTRRSLTLPADDTYTSTYYNDVCVRYSRSSSRCTLTRFTVSVPAWKSLSYGQSCTTRRGGGGRGGWRRITTCGPLYPNITDVPQPHTSKTITLTKTKTVDIVPVVPTLTTTKTGTGTGTLTSAPSGISCGADCTEIYTGGEEVILTSSPATGSTFVSWSGEGCTGTGTCTVLMDQNRNVSAEFYSPPQCSDTVDNPDPEDIRIDANDPGCYTAGVYDPNDNDETDTLPQCSNDFDDDGDSLADSDDPDCQGSGGYDPDDNNESGSIGVTQCADGLDNDGNGDIDYPADITGCSSASDNDESLPPPPECSDTVDNADAEDLKADAADPGCYTGGVYDPDDNDETNTLPQCSNFFDDDGDGNVDYPEDTGCSDALDDREQNISFIEF